MIRSSVTRPAPMPPHWCAAIVLGMNALACSPLQAAIVGGLSNFDAVNDTGKPAYGFEIEFDDASFYSNSVGSVFGLNRVFSFVSPDPHAVVRFGTVTVSDFNDAAGVHAGVRVVYGGNPAGAFTPANDPANPFASRGESCWPGANRSWTANPCDHFGVVTTRTPAVTRYSWLVPSAGNPSFLEKQALGIPAVVAAYTPPPVPAPAPPPVLGAPPAPVPAPAPAVLNVQIQAVAPNPEQPENVDLWGEAYWVKTYTTKVSKQIDLGNLLRGDPDMEKAEVESEWSIFQKAPAGHMGANEVKDKNLELGDADKAVMRRYEFFKYAGPLNVDGSGEVDCNAGCEVDPLGVMADQDHFGQSYVGNFVGAQMAGFNIQAAVPETSTWAMLVAGLGLIGFVGHRRRP